MTKRASSNILNVNLTEEDQKDLNELMDFFQSQSVSKINRSNVIKFLLKKHAELIRVSLNDGKDYEEFWRVLGIDINFKV